MHFVAEGCGNLSIRERLIRCRERFFTGRRKLATLAAAGLAVAVGYHVVFGADGLTSYEQKRHESVVLARQMDDLTRENEALRSHVTRLNNDPDAIEHQAREQLHYTRPGEVIYAMPAK